MSLHESTVMNGTSSGCPQDKQGQWNSSTKLTFVVDMKWWIQSSLDPGALSAACSGMLGGDKEGKEEAGLQ